MSNIILITGALAAGKSTFARALSQRLRLPCFLKDTVKEALGLCLPYKNREQNAAISAASFQMLLYCANAFAESEADLILESNFKPNEIDDLNTHCQGRGTHMLTFILHGDMQCLFERFQIREASPERHVIHKSASATTMDAFRAYNDPLLSVKPAGETVKIDTTDIASVDFEIYYSIADAFLHGGAV